MPELPEVETIKRDLTGHVIGQKIISTLIKDEMVIRATDPKHFVKHLQGKKIVDIARRGKAIIFKFAEGDFLVVQLVMTGQLIYGKEIKESNVTFMLSNRQYLNYNDQRRFGRLSLANNLEDIKFFQTLGPEPLSGEFDCECLRSRLRNRKAPIKSLLKNQSFVAGIGNIYACEILFRSKINPRREAHTLREEEIEVLHRVTVKVLKEAIDLRGSSVNTYRDLYGQKGNFVSHIKVYGRENKECVFCRTPIERIVIGGRSTFFCRRCQG